MAPTIVGIILLADPTSPSTHSCHRGSFLQCTNQVWIRASLAVAKKERSGIISHLPGPLFPYFLHPIWYRYAELAVMIPGESVFFQPWNQKENFMIKLAYVAFTALILIASGCASMGETTSSSGDSTNLSQSSLYSGGIN